MAKAQAGGNSSESKSNTSILTAIEEDCYPRVDADVLEWLKSQGKGYQSRINAILRREMLTAMRTSPAK